MNVRLHPKCYLYTYMCIVEDELYDTNTYIIYSLASLLAKLNGLPEDYI